MPPSLSLSPAPGEKRGGGRRRGRVGEGTGKVW